MHCPQTLLYHYHDLLAIAQLHQDPTVLHTDVYGNICETPSAIIGQTQEQRERAFHKSGCESQQAKRRSLQFERQFHVCTDASVQLNVCDIRNSFPPSLSPEALASGSKEAPPFLSSSSFASRATLLFWATRSCCVTFSWSANKATSLSKSACTKTVCGGRNIHSSMYRFNNSDDSMCW